MADQGGRLRRDILRSAFAATATAVLANCQTLPPFTLEEAVRRLLYRSTQRAFARLTAPDGYWNETIRAAGLSRVLGLRGEMVTQALTSPLFRDRLEDAFADIALDAADRSAPVVADAVRTLGIRNALAIVNGGPRAATGYLRSEMGSRLIESLFPEIGRVDAIVRDPLIGQFVEAMSGVDISEVITNFSSRIEEFIWQEIGREEAAIRANPVDTGDAAILAAFG